MNWVKKAMDSPLLFRISKKKKSEVREIKNGKQSNHNSK